MQRAQRTLCAVALFLLTLLPVVGATAMPAYADVAPPVQAPGSNPAPSAPTKVQMLSEKVVLQVLRVKGKGNDDLPLAQVSASFIMRNGGSADESMTVRFPINDPGGNGDGFGGQPEIRNVAIKVNGSPVRTSVVTTPNPHGPKQPDIKWAAFDTTFPADKDTFIEVSYALDSTGYLPYGTFNYILETGAGWEGQIGDAQIMLNLPYDATDENVVLEESTPNGVIAGGNVSWEFKNIKPKREDNFHVTVLSPSVWERIVAARAETQRKPDDAQVWRDLAKTYRSAIFVKYGPQTGAKFVPQIEQAYAHAMDIDKTSAQLPAELAETLLDIYPAITGGLDKDAAPRIFAALGEAFKRDPKNATALRLLKDLRTLLSQQVTSGNSDQAVAAKTQLDALNKLATTAGVDQSAPVPPATPSAQPAAPATPTVAATAVVIITPTEEATTMPAGEGGVQTHTATVSTTTDSGVIITTTNTTTATQAMTDAITSRPITVITMTETSMITSTSDVTGTLPATITEVSHTSVVTSMMPMPPAIPPSAAPVTTTSGITPTTAMTPTGEAAAATGATPAPQISATALASTTGVLTGVVTGKAATTMPLSPTAEVTATTGVTPMSQVTATSAVGATGEVTSTSEPTTTATGEMTSTIVMTPTSPVRTTGETTATSPVTSTPQTQPVAAGPYSQVITASTTATKTAIVTDAKTGVLAPSTMVTATDVATKTVAANPIDATKPATTTTSEVGSITSAPVVTDTTQPFTTNTTVVTKTTTLPPTGSAMPAVTSVITQTDVATATMKPGDANTPPSVEVVTQTKVQSATIDSTGVITAAPPVVKVITATLPTTPTGATGAAGISGTVTSTITATAPADKGTLSGTVTGAITATTEVTSEANATAEPTISATEEPITATAETSGTATTGGATTPAASGSTGNQPIGWLALVATYVIGASVVYGLSRRRREDSD